MTHSPPEIRALLDAINRHPRRELGQNFVADPNTVRRIADLAKLGPTDHVIEIGAGLGSLTLALAETGAQVTALEVDSHLVAALNNVTAGLANVEVVHADAMSVDWDEIADPSISRHWSVVANLPYNIATPLVCDLLDGVPQVNHLLVMVQREVAERFAAQPGSRTYGAVSIKAAYWATARLVGNVPPAVFIPRPRVESALVDIVRRDPPDVAAEAVFELVGIAFGQRRKMLRRSLGATVQTAAFAQAGIDPTRRPEELGLDEWCALAAAHRGAGRPGAGEP